MLPLEPDIRVIALDFCTSVCVSLAVFGLDDLALPFAREVPICSVAHRMAALQKSLSMNSLTRTRSGEHGEAPPKLKRARTTSLAASGIFEVRSTTATVREDGAFTTE
jgi:hypothetical protein